ncbi:MAG: ThiF family adenylyltransferase [Candidatus Thorarchaeota archaeon]|nr:ThiF family adenylyltransferase [Candidatus Thorarchaeota archaeon]
MDFDRIQYILAPEELEKKRVVVIGLGSGGAPVVQHLAMSGVRKWSLFDPDLLDEVNLVKHPGMRKDLGKTKIAVIAEWLMDRNPDSEIREFPEDILDSTDFEREARNAHLIISATDTLSVRQFINRIAVRHGIPCVTASVFRTAFGGEVYSYIPGKTGCYQCMNIVSGKLGWGNIENQVEMTEDEQDRIYGLGQEDYRASGLSMDIAIISAIMAKRALSLLLDSPNPVYFPQDSSNYLIFYMRGMGSIPSLSSLKYAIPAQKDCFCSFNDGEESAANEISDLE